MGNLMSVFDNAWLRFAISGTLIACYGLADRFARGPGPARPARPSPFWVRWSFVVSLTAFYFLIRPTGGALLGGFGNLGGLLGVGIAIAIRVLRPVRYPELAGRMLFYLALPLAVGVPWGLLALSLPACAASLGRWRAAERAGDAVPLPEGATPAAEGPRGEGS